MLNKATRICAKLPIHHKSNLQGSRGPLAAFPIFWSSVELVNPRRGPKVSRKPLMPPPKRKLLYYRKFRKKITSNTLKLMCDKFAGDDFKNAFGRPKNKPL